MAKTKLTYRIVNAQAVTTEREAELDGETVTVRQTRAVIEAEPEQAGGKTFSAVLPADALDQFPEGATLTITLEAEA